MKRQEPEGEVLCRNGHWPSYLRFVLCPDLSRIAILLYRQVMYYIAAKSVVAAIRGRSVAWAKVERKATVPMG